MKKKIASAVRLLVRRPRNCPSQPILRRAICGLCPVWHVVPKMSRVSCELEVLVVRCVVRVEEGVVVRQRPPRREMPEPESSAGTGKYRARSMGQRALYVLPEP